MAGQPEGIPVVTESAYLLFALGAIAAVGDWLGRRRIGRWIGGAIMTLILAAILANLGVIPTATQAPPLYRHLVAIGAPISIFLLLLDIRLDTLKRAGLPMLTAFAIGAIGTLVGVATAYWITGAHEWLGDKSAAVGGMYAATYIGGSLNLNAVAVHYGVVEQPALMAGTNIVDGVVGTLWLASLVIIARLVHRLSGTRLESAVVASDEIQDSRSITVVSVATLLALAFGGFWLSGEVSTWASSHGVTLPAILVLTTLALVAAQVPAVQRLGGASTLGIYVAYLFLAVIGASCDFRALMEMGHIGGMLLLFVALAVLIHGVIQFGAGRLLRLSPETLAIASSANVGGAVTIMPIARGLGRMDLLLPGIVVGMLGNAIGTYAGFTMAWFLQAGPSPISAAHAIPPPPEQSTANCTNPTYASDAFVCADKELLALDQRVRSTLVVTSLANAVAPTSLVEDQEAWFKRRSRCAFSERQAGCLRAAYSERIVVLDALRKATLELAQSGAKAACRDAPWGSEEVRMTLDDHGLATVMDTEGRVLAVALGREPRDDWAPFVRFSAEGETVRFSALDHSPVECHALPSVRR